MLTGERDAEKRKDIKLIMQPSFRFNSTVTVDRPDMGREVALSNQPSSKTQSNEAFGVFTRARNTEVLPEGYHHLAVL